MPDSDERTHTLRRRDFLTGAAAVAALALIKPSAVRGQGANEKLQLGVIGCGGRGSWLAGLFEQHSNTKVVAIHDYFQDRADAGRERFGVAPEDCSTGLSGFRQLLERDIDAVAIESPPYFHPEQAAAAVAAGKHVYIAKPLAVDVPGCQSIQESADKARERGLSFLVDFQTRNNPSFIEAARRVHAGDIGDIVCGQAYYHCGMFPPEFDSTDAEARLRNWVYDRGLSGDIIVEQNIHVLDVATWFIDNHPLSAQGTGGRGARELGTCWDHFSVAYKFPNDVVLDFCSTQFLTGFSDLCDRIYGTRGTVETHYGGDVWLDNGERWQGDSTADIYAQGAISNIKDFCAGIESGDVVNTSEQSVRSNLTCILGRTAAYEEEEVSWDDMLDDAEEMECDLEGLRE